METREEPRILPNHWPTTVTVQFNLQARTRSLPRQGSNLSDKRSDLQQYIRDGVDFSYLEGQSNSGSNSTESISSQTPQPCTEDCGTNPSPESYAKCNNLAEISEGSGYITTNDQAVDNTGSTHLPSNFNVGCRSTGCERGNQNKSNSLPPGLKVKFS